MEVGFKLALPLLRATLNWRMVLIMAMVALAALVTDSVGIGLGASAGAGATLALSIGLGLHLKRCRSRTLSATLPGFPATSLVAAFFILFSLVLAIAALDGWRLDSLLAVNAAAALGLGVGLALPPRVLQWVCFAPFLWVAAGNRDLVTIWSGPWSPLLAAFCLLIGLAVYSRMKRWDPRLHLQWPSASVAIPNEGKGRSPWRRGYLLSPWTPMGGLAMGVVLGVALPIASLGEPVFTRLDPVRQIELTGYLVLFSGIGILTMLVELLGIGMLTLRKLAVLPGWSRAQLFTHAERSAWRVTLGTAFVLGLVLMATGIWSGEARWGLWLQGLVIFVSLSLLGIYAALWMAWITGSGVRIFILTVAFIPLLLIAAGLFFEGSYESGGHAALSVPLALISVATLAWWLRRQARSAWTSISFSRES